MKRRVLKRKAAPSREIPLWEVTLRTTNGAVTCSVKVHAPSALAVPARAAALAQELHPRGRHDARREWHILMIRIEDGWQNRLDKLVPVLSED